MKVYQRQIVELPFNLTQGVQNHPAIVLSQTEIIEQEEAFVAVMITSENYSDEYTFEIMNSMLENGKFNESYNETRLHLVSYFSVKDIIPNKNTSTLKKVKSDYFSRIIKQIVRVTFGQN